jgi:hypothetical protein
VQKFISPGAVKLVKRDCKWGGRSRQDLEPDLERGALVDPGESYGCWGVLVVDWH